MPTIYATHRHYKGGTYCLLGEATIEGTMQPVAVYQSIADLRVWVRPLEEFNGTVKVDGHQVPRFAKMKRTRP